jgi:hypothetical protein
MLLTYLFCLQVYPYAEPKTRILSNKRKKASDPREVFCVDLQVEETLQAMWNADPSSFQTMEAYSAQVCATVNAINKGRAKDPNFDWEVDDYYTAIKGLDHPRLGKVPMHIAIVAYADGIDHVAAIGAFAGKKKVVASLVEILLWPPAERVQQQHLVLVNVCFEKVAKQVGYRKLWGGDVDDKNCSSLGGSCRRLKNGVAFLKPDGSTSTYTGSHILT